MCGIVGYTGREQAAGILLDGLRKLEYRGYDSAGIAVRNGAEQAQVVKTLGKLDSLISLTDGGKTLMGKCGIGHTRWATHGVPSVANAHPHVSGNCRNTGNGPVESAVVGVHNGIIENYMELKEKLLTHGYMFYSETDTEVLVKLVDYYYRKYKIGPIDAINRTMVRARGSYALTLMFTDYPGEIYAARKDSPLIIGRTEDASFLASDVPAILNYTRDVYYIQNHQSARITPDSVTFFDLNGDKVVLPETHIEWDALSAEKDGYEHFMLKEIHEQPKVVSNTLKALDFQSIGLTDTVLKGIRQICITGCGSAWHVGMAAQYVIEDLASVPVRVELASEFRYRSIPFSEGTLVIVISQSGETADSLAALRKAKECGLMVLAVVNVMGSSIAREADFVLHTVAGPEISVATTKAFSAQLICMDLFAIQLGYVKGLISQEKYDFYIKEASLLPDKIQMILDDKQKLQWLSTKLAAQKSMFFIGRSLDYSICLEGSLKMKEISYIHSEAYAAGELKHGTISLIEEGTVVLGVMTEKSVLEKTYSNMVECKARGAYLVSIVSGNTGKLKEIDFNICIPDCDAVFTPSLAIVPLQLLSYYTSINRGLDVDKPRNLAKSVTVE
ncbi:MAG: glutamine--fructose-6-phosphate transaminase (isomerizing) [Sphaerochaetaceae bacterium]|nr:glutamine--fructose-6-phosphate transaminase (isomerizing) [Sphaerochaetaceae bacterium]